MIFSALKKLPFYRRYTTNQFKQWWARRNIDWQKEYSETWNHPHRYFITANLLQMNWGSLIEIGCGSGPNLINIVRNTKGKQIGGVDISPQAIETARKTFKNAVLSVGPGDDVFMSDKSSDIILSDMMLIYVGPRKINRYIQEMKRLARNYIVLSEFHSSSWWERFKLRLFSGHNSYNYRKLLEKHGFYDISINKYPPNSWPEDDNNKFRRLIIAKTPKYL